MRQRLALATALLGDPSVLVLDEPANGLDPEGIQWLRGFLRHLAHDEGRTILVSSHLLSEVEQTVDRVVIVSAGQLVREGTMEELRSGAQGAGTVLVRSPEATRFADVLRAQGTSVSQQDGVLTVTGSTTDDVGRHAFAAGIELHELRAHSSGLEEIYFQLTSGTEQFAAPSPGTTVAQEADR
jgi:ABC-2 type transport system ATP-binding protein